MNEPLVYSMDALPRVVGLSRATLYRMIKRGEFPEPVALSPNRVGWRASDVRDWLEERPRHAAAA